MQMWDNHKQERERGYWKLSSLKIAFQHHSRWWLHFLHLWTTWYDFIQRVHFFFSSCELTCFNYFTTLLLKKVFLENDQVSKWNDHIFFWCTAEKCDDKFGGETNGWGGRTNDQRGWYGWWWSSQLWGVCKDDDDFQLISLSLSYVFYHLSKLLLKQTFLLGKVLLFVKLCPHCESAQFDKTRRLWGLGGISKIQWDFSLTGYIN